MFKFKTNHWVLGVIVLTAILVSSLSGTLFSADIPKDRLVIDFVGNVRGYLEPCGCHSGQYGGVARRATYLSRLKQSYPHPVTVFNGDMGINSNSQEKVKTEYLFEAFDKMGYDAMNMGENEFTFGWDFVKGLQSRYNNLISANIYNKESGKLLFNPYLIKSVPVIIAGETVMVKVGIVGVMDPTYESIVRSVQGGPSLEVSDPVEALNKYIPEMRKDGAVMVVVLGHIGMQDSLDMLKKVKDVDLWVAGHEPFQYVENPKKVGKTIVVLNGDRGRWTGYAAYQMKNRKQSVFLKTQETTLNEGIPDDVSMSGLVMSYKKGLTLPVPPKNTISIFSWNKRPSFAGAQSCLQCHPRMYFAWRKTAHSKALVSLKQKHSDQRVECVVCHTVGYGKGGYVNEKQTPRLAGVQCESCHGSGLRHVAAAYGQHKNTIFRPKGPETCLTCHDKEHDPKFVYVDKKLKIKHWH